MQEGASVGEGGHGDGQGVALDFAGRETALLLTSVDVGHLIVGSDVQQDVVHALERKQDLLTLDILNR